MATEVISLIMATSTLASILMVNRKDLVNTNGLMDPHTLVTLSKA